MSKLRKLVLTTAALAALAVGGAAFAQAQNAAPAAPIHKAVGETSPPGDTDNAQSGDQGGPELNDPGQGGQESENDGAAEPSQDDRAGGHQDEPDTASADHEVQGDE